MSSKIGKCMDSRITKIVFVVFLLITLLFSVVIFFVGLTHLPSIFIPSESLYKYWYGKASTIYHEFIRMCRLYTEVALEEVKMLVHKHILFNITKNGIILHKEYSKFLNKSVQADIESKAQAWAFKMERGCLGLGIGGSIVCCFTWLACLLALLAWISKRKQKMVLAYRLYLIFCIILGATTFIHFILGVSVGGCSYLNHLATDDERDLDSSFVNCRDQFSKAKNFFIDQVKVYKPYDADRVHSKPGSWKINFVDMIQRDYRCCGWNGISDWTYNPMYNCGSNSTDYRCNVPHTCCHSPSMVTICNYLDRPLKNVQPENHETIPEDKNFTSEYLYQNGCFAKTIKHPAANVNDDYIEEPFLPSALFVEGIFLIFLSFFELVPFIIGILYVKKLVRMKSDIPMKELPNEKDAYGTTA